MVGRSLGYVRRQASHAGRRILIGFGCQAPPER
jgi:hypothetical protein